MTRTHSRQVINFLQFVCLTIIVAFSFSLTACEKEADKCQLQIHCRDTLGNPLANVNVKIYKQAPNFNIDTNVIAEKYSDSKGNVLFDNLEAARYYPLAEKGCLNNKVGFFPGRPLIQPGILNTDTTRLWETAKLRVTNISSHQVTVTALGTTLSMIQTGETKDLMVLAGNRNINTQYAPAGLNKDTTLILVCGEIRPFTVPF